MMGWSRRGWRRAPMKLLLIEDDVRVAWVLAEALGAEGHETTSRYSGEDGLAYLARERPDTVLLDVRLPAIPAVWVLRQFRASAQPLPAIIVTCLAPPGDSAGV